MNKPVTITVEPCHIRAGKPSEPKSCPIALAIAPFWPGAEVTVDEIQLPWKGIIVPLPKIAQSFVTKFDADGEDKPLPKMKRVKPIKFTVRIPEAA